MLKRTFIAATLFSIALPQSVFGGDKALTAAAIQKLLSGNTAEGKWDGSRYKQYFGTDGKTLYVEGGSKSKGQWRVNAKKNGFESKWSGGGWNRYGIVKTTKGYAWVERSGKQQPFVVKKGNTLK